MDAPVLVPLIDEAVPLPANAAEALPDLSREQEIEMRDRALAFAQLSPMQQADYGFYRGGQQLGDVVGGALGGQDPQLKLISQRQRLLSQLDRSDPESYKK